MSIINLAIGLSATGVGCLASGWWSINSFKKARYLLDTPTSKIRSAAQGYVELYGELKTGHGLLKAPLSHEPCVWWSFSIDEQVPNDRDDKRWQQVEKSSSTALLSLEDGTGECWIDPVGAQVIPMTRKVWYGSARHPLQMQLRSSPVHSMLRGVKRYRYTEQRLHSAEPLYAIGDFITRGSGHDSFDLDANQSALISQWKADYADLMQRFDSDRNGQLSEQEWQQVKDSAKANAQEIHRTNNAKPAQHFLSKPQEKQPFILSSYGEEKIAKRFNRQAILGAILCIVTALGFTYIINSNF